MSGAVVETTLGPVRGVHDGIHRFSGIPYAAAPAGPLRFRQPRPPWTGELDATRLGPSCPQPGRGAGNERLAAVFGAFGMPVAETREDDDCLVLNVWTPGLTGARPVLVRIHGGGFVTGSGSWPWYDGGNLARRGDVVVLTVNHRLGALGYLYLDELAGGGLPGLG